MRPVDRPAAAQAGQPAEPFWRTKTLREMTAAEWESLCDGCGRCCLLKLQDEDTDRIAYTDVACRLLDCDSCRCSNYPERAKHVPDCVQLTPAVVEEIGWLPKTCGYRLIRDGEDLRWWHPLVSGSAETVHEAGVSVRDRVFCSETEIAEEDLEDRMVSWPAKGAGGAAKKYEKI
ncbi:YcgN family cysteine cluster protein [Methylopila sp. M107]|uniref:YcgN family cysteine cluster protein n=1 Tax=Methylopila sp. M107 TaxID=1101190 RepID=UPI00039F19D7|nr:YcgN family cysteine cluster protein [Methylopila sp. M107]